MKRGVKTLSNRVKARAVGEPPAVQLWYGDVYVELTPEEISRLCEWWQQSEARGADPLSTQTAKYEHYKRHKAKAEEAQARGDE